MGSHVALAAAVDLNHPSYVVHWGVLQVTLANVIVIGVMVLLFVLAMLLPFPKGRDRR